MNLVLYLVTDRCSCLILGAPVIFHAGFERLAGTTPNEQFSLSAVILARYLLFILNTALL